MAFMMAGEDDVKHQSGRIEPYRAQDGGRGANRPHNVRRRNWWCTSMKDKEMVGLKLAAKEDNGLLDGRIGPCRTQNGG